MVTCLHCVGHYVVENNPLLLRGLGGIMWIYVDSYYLRVSQWKLSSFPLTRVHYLCFCDYNNDPRRCQIMSPHQPMLIGLHVFTERRGCV